MSLSPKTFSDLGEKEAIKLAWLTGLSQFLLRFIKMERNCQELLNSELRRKNRDDHLKVLKEAENMTGDIAHDFVIKYKYRELIRIGLMELELKNLSDYKTILYELSALYDAILLTTFRMIAGKDEPFIIYALGKLGGEEVNLSSDVDLILLCDDDINYERALKTAKSFLSLLSEKRFLGFLLRPDIDLRPHGRFSPPVIKISHAVEYYFTQAQTWERYALIKLRKISGTEDEFTKVADKFVFRRYMEVTALDEIYELKKKIELTEEKGKEWNLKLGRGGIREAEFFLQSFQIIYGGKIPSLKEKNTFKLLKALVSENLLDKNTAAEIERAYTFLRRLENAIQWENELQTHKLPLSLEARKIIAKKLHMDLKEFEQTLEESTSFIRNLFGSLFKEKEKDTFYLPLPQSEMKKLLPHLNEKERHAIHRTINELTEGKSSETVKRISAVIKNALDVSKEHKTPYDTFVRFLKVTSSLSRFPPYLSLLGEKKSILEYIMQIISQSDYISDVLTREPHLIENLLTATSLPLKEDFIKNELSNRITRFYDLEDILEELNRFKSEITFHILVKDLVEEEPLPRIFEYITNLADAIMWICLGIAKGITFGEKNFAKFLEDSNESPILIVGMGKYGGRELNYYSDLDLIFLYKDEKSHATMAKIAQKILFLLTTPTTHGTLYQTDTRLRPSGRAGQLVSSISSFKNYHSKSSQTWEKQALLKARPVAGAIDLWNEVQNFALEKIFGEVDQEKTRKDIIEMREKMKVRETRGKGWDLKMMEGGIVDIEFIVQFLQLTNINKAPFLLTPATLDAINKLKEVNIVTDEVCEKLKSRYLFLRDVERGVRLMARRGEDFLKRNSVKEILNLLKEKLASEDEFLTKLNSAREDIKTIYKQVFKK